MYDVAVIGAGVTGSQVAARLAGMGHSVIVIEGKRSLTDPVCCTGIIGRECVTSFAIEEDIIQRWVKGARVFSPSGKMLRLWRPERQAAIVDRVSLNISMIGKAQGRGARYEVGTLIRDIEVSGNGVNIKAIRGDEPVNLEARVAVIATGFSPGLTERLGLGRTGDFVTGVQAEVMLPELDNVEVYLGQDTAPSFFAWTVPTSFGMGLVGLLSRRTPEVYLRKLLTSLAEQGKIASADVEVLHGGISLKPLSKTYGERLLVVGTAAGQVKPITGGGIYYGLLCANIAAEHLHNALVEDNLSAKSLAGYQRKWKKLLGSELRTGYWARRVFDRLGDNQIDRLFDVVESTGILDALLKADDLSFDWHGGAVSRVIGYEVFRKVIGSVKLPARLNNRIPGREQPVE
ncbi:MAG TPA: NAD(P)/FAD-dependent oxidoreductase [Dehalococcoidia bacterium]|nr:NAD(P)/FAD-dependent oxidoreductase [Dehalococcoidia bacterium]